MVDTFRELGQRWWLRERGTEREKRGQLSDSFTSSASEGGAGECREFLHVLCGLAGGTGDKTGGRPWLRLLLGWSSRLGRLQDGGWYTRARGGRSGKLRKRYYCSWWGWDDEIVSFRGVRSHQTRGGGVVVTDHWAR